MSKQPALPATLLYKNKNLANRGGLAEVLLNRITTVEVCDATKADSSNAADQNKFQLKISKSQHANLRLPVKNIFSSACPIH